MPLATHSVIAGVDELEMNWKLKFSDSAFLIFYNAETRLYIPRKIVQFTLNK